MFTRLNDGQVAFGSKLLNPGQRREAMNLCLDVIEPHQRVEFGQQLFDRALGREFGLNDRRRELGLPAIIGVVGALTGIPDGAEIELDPV